MSNEQGALENMKENIALYCDNPGVREYWEVYQRFYPIEINRLVAEAIGDEGLL